MCPEHPTRTLTSTTLATRKRWLLWAWDRRRHAVANRAMRPGADAGLCAAPLQHHTTGDAACMRCLLQHSSTQKLEGDFRPASDFALHCISWIKFERFRSGELRSLAAPQLRITCNVERLHFAVQIARTCTWQHVASAMQTFLCFCPQADSVIQGRPPSALLCQRQTIKCKHAKHTADERLTSLARGEHAPAFLPEVARVQTTLLFSQHQASYCARFSIKSWFSIKSLATSYASASLP